MIRAQGGSFLTESRLVPADSNERRRRSGHLHGLASLTETRKSLESLWATDPSLCLPHPNSTFLKDLHGRQVAEEFLFLDKARWLQEELKLKQKGGNGLHLLEENIRRREEPVSSNQPEEEQEQEQEQEEEEEDRLIVAEENHHSFQDEVDEALAVVQLLKDCARHKDLHQGIKVHADIVRNGLLEKNIFVGSTLVSMYGKCGALQKAQGVFDELPIRNVVLWNAIIAGYAQHGNTNAALSCYEHMQLDGFSPNAATFVPLLKACGSMCASDEGKEIHAQIVRMLSLEKNMVVVNALGDMYAKCGAPDEEQEVLNDLRLWDQKFCDDESEVVTIVTLLKVCARRKDLRGGVRLHIYIARRGLLEKSAFIGSSLISMYAKCGILERVQEVFNELPVWNIVSWNALIAGYNEHGHSEEALNCYGRMQLEGCTPNKVTFVCLFKACSTLGASDKGSQIHAQMVRRHSWERDTVVANALITMYAKSGELGRAQEVFDKLAVKDVVSWTTLISGNAHHGHGEEAWRCWKQMQLEGFSPNAVTFVSILNACSSIGALEKGQEIHSQIDREHFLERNVLVANAVVGMYAKCGELGKAQEVFDRVQARNVVSWNVLIAAYAQRGHPDKALGLFERMQVEGFSPDMVTFVCALKACGTTGAIDQGKGIHAEIVKARLLETDIRLRTALVDMYAKCGSLLKAQEVFDDSSIRDVVLWTTLIIGYAQQEHSEEALRCFDHMQFEGFFPDAITFECVLKACGSIGAACKGQKIHADVVRYEESEYFKVMGSALVDMYANSGMLREAQDVFEELPVQDLVSWGALMEGYSQLGRDDVVLNVLDQMIQQGTLPNSIIFTIMLNTCCHGGLLNKGQIFFEHISKDFGFITSLEQHTCMVDLFCRAGHVDEAMRLIEEMPMMANLSLWLTLLVASQNRGIMKLGRWAFECAVQLDGKAGAAFVCFSNMYVAAGRQEDDNRIKAMRQRNQAWEAWTEFVN